MTRPTSAGPPDTGIGDDPEAGLRETRYRGLLDGAPDALVVVSASGRIELVNAQAERLFRASREELVGQPVEILIPDRYRAGHADLRARYCANPRPRPLGVGLELQAIRRDGTEFPVEISLSPVAAGGELLVTAAVRDVSDRKQREATRAAEQEEHNLRIQEASRLKGEFLANMSHELRTPLNAIIGFSKLLHTGRIGPLAPEQKQPIADILESAEHLLRLINDVLDLSKIEAGKLAFHPEPVDLQQILAGACDALAPLARERGIVPEVSVPAGLGPVDADPARLKQVLFNFISNALKFSPDGGRVVVRARPDGEDRYRIEVQDEGIGIAPEDVERLFVEFQQLDTGLAKRHPGTGLGLALTRRLVEAQGGSVGVTTEPGRGSTFFAVLPMCNQKDHA